MKIRLLAVLGTFVMVGGFALAGGGRNTGGSGYSPGGSWSTISGIDVQYRKPGKCALVTSAPCANKKVFLCTSATPGVACKSGCASFFGTLIANWCIG